MNSERILRTGDNKVFTEIIPEILVIEAGQTIDMVRPRKRKALPILRQHLIWKDCELWKDTQHTSKL